MSDKTGKRKVRLGGGETVSTGDNFFAQRLYMDAFERRLPDAMRELASIAASRTSSADAIVDWAQRWGFPVNGWWFRQIRNHVRHWRDFPGDNGHWVTFFGVFRQPRFPSIAWNPNEETEAQFRSRVDDYVSAVKAMPGIAAAPTEFYERDFDCLVLQHAGRRPIAVVLESLCLQDDVDATTVGKRTTRLASVLGLPLRKSAGGRPRRDAQKPRKKKIAHSP